MLSFNDSIHGSPSVKKRIITIYVFMNFAVVFVWVRDYHKSNGTNRVKIFQNFYFKQEHRHEQL